MAELPAELDLVVPQRSTAFGAPARKDYPSDLVTDNRTPAVAWLYNVKHGSTRISGPRRLARHFCQRECLFAIDPDADLLPPRATSLSVPPHTLDSGTLSPSAVELIDTDSYRRMPDRPASRRYQTDEPFPVEHSPEDVYKQAPNREMTAHQREGTPPTQSPYPVLPPGLHPPRQLTDAQFPDNRLLH